MRKSDFESTVLLPCLNEEETIKICILKAKNCIRENNLNAEILVADNGSSDNSISIARKNGARVVSIKEKGYGSALIGGTKEAKGKYCIMADSDDSYDFSSLMPYIEKLREGYDLVMGNRFMGGIADGAMPFLHRYLGTPVLSFLGRALFNNKIGDYNCGMRGYNTKRILELNLNCSGMEYASEMIVKSSIYGYKICEVPTKLKKDGRSRKPHLNTWKDGWRHLIFMLKHAPKQVFFMTSIVFALISLFLLCSIKTDSIIVPYLFLMFSLLGILLFMLYLFSMIIAYKNNYLPFNDGLEKKIILKLYNSDSIFFIGLILLPISIFSLLIFKTTKIILVFTVLTFLSLILMFSDIY